MGLRTFLQLTLELLRETASPTQKATVFDAQQAINDSYRELCQYYNWPWLLDRYDIPIYPGYTTGTISCTVGSTIVTGSGTNWNFAAGTAGWWNKKILMPNTRVGFEIVQFNSATQLTLRYPYNAPTNVVGSEYTIYQDDYPTPVIAGHDMIFTNPQWLQMRLNKVDPWTFKDKTQFMPFMAVQGPRMVTDSGADWNVLSPYYQQPRFQFWPIPNSTQVIVLGYYKNPAPLALDGDFTILPPEFEEVLIKLARFRLKMKFGIQGWMEDQTIAYRTLDQFREKQATSVALDQQVGGAGPWGYNDAYGLDTALGYYPGNLVP